MGRTTALLGAFMALAACLPDYVLREGAGSVGGGSSSLSSSSAGGGGAGGGTCGDPSCDPHNCGAPGHDCLGGECVNGACTPAIIAQKVSDSSGITVAAGYFYFRVDYTWTVYACPTAGCGDKNVNAVTMDVGPIGEGDMRNDGAGVFWTVSNTSGQIRRCQTPVCGGGAKDVASMLDTPTSLALDAQSFYFTTFSPMGNVERCPITGCGPNNAMATVLASGRSFPDRLLHQQGRLYWTEGPPQTILSCLDTGCGAGPTQIASGVWAPALASDAQSIYYATPPPGLTLMRCPLAGCMAGKSSLAKLDDVPLALTTDGGFLYWLEQGTQDVPSGTLHRMPVKGGSQETLAKDLPYPSALAIDSAAIYWTNRGTKSQNLLDGVVMRLAK